MSKHIYNKDELNQMLSLAFANVSSVGEHYIRDLLHARKRVAKGKQPREVLMTVEEAVHLQREIRSAPLSLFRDLDLREEVEFRTSLYR